MATAEADELIRRDNAALTVKFYKVVVSHARIATGFDGHAWQAHAEASDGMEHVASFRGRSVLAALEIFANEVIKTTLDAMDSREPAPIDGDDVFPVVRDVVLRFDDAVNETPRELLECLQEEFSRVLSFGVADEEAVQRGWLEAQRLVECVFAFLDFSTYLLHEVYLPAFDEMKAERDRTNVTGDPWPANEGDREFCKAVHDAKKPNVMAMAREHAIRSLGKYTDEALDTEISRLRQVWYRTKPLL